LIFVCHDVGGLLVKQTCLLSIGPDFGSFHHRLCGISFLATPHHGSRDDWEKIFGPFHRDKPTDPEWEYGIEHMNFINEQFSREFGKIPVVSLCETQPVRISGKKTLLVTEHNARLDCSRECFQRLDANHHNMCKYESPDSQNYQVVRELLATLLPDVSLFDWPLSAAMQR
jgi:hypothetical protein